MLWWNATRDLILGTAVLLGYAWLTTLSLRIRVLRRRLALHICGTPRRSNTAHPHPDPDRDRDPDLEPEDEGFEDQGVEQGAHAAHPAYGPTDRSITTAELLRREAAHPRRMLPRAATCRPTTTPAEDTRPLPRHPHRGTR